MSADLLRNAAKTLRQHAASLPSPWVDQPWRVVQTDTESLDGLAACTDAHADDPHGAFDCCWSSEPVGHERVAAFARLMHPPVALALADWLEFAADMRSGDGAEVRVDWRTDYALALARAILREGQTDDHLG